MTSRLIIVSNRLPVTVKAQDGRIDIARSSGGLATGLQGPHERSQGLWVGWPGDVGELTADPQADLEQRMIEMRFVPVHLSREQIDDYYSGFSNGVIWPLFHYLLDRVPADALAWEAYRSANARFAAKVAEHYRPGDIIWVHDFHLSLVPEMLRERFPDARIGFFLHIPFPSSEVFRILPWRKEILQGLLGADLIGFHTYTYARHFTSALLRILGIDAQIDRIMYQDRQVRVGSFPLGIDSETFARNAADPEVVQEAASLRSEQCGEALLLSIDRLDYTKGIPRRLAAFDRLLELEPSWIGRVKMIQVAVPTRTDSPMYMDFRRQVEEATSRVNGRHGTLHWNPITYLYQSFTPLQLAAMYRAADVMLVTPLRDGMNLVAKEFLASRIDDQGVLVLSEFAGAASELGEAVIVNPYDVDDMARSIHRALTMTPEEQRERMQALRERVRTYDVYHWVDSFLSQLEACGSDTRSTPRRLSEGADFSALARELSRGEQLVVLLDYDGTLVPFARAPDLARPDEALTALLATLASRPGIAVHVLSGRSRVSLEAWLGDLPIGLSAEHGYWLRPPGHEPWTVLGAPISEEWRSRVLALLMQFSERIAGAFIEEKSSSLVWHYRNVDPWLGGHLACELRLHLAELLSNAPFEVLPGHKVVEVRRAGVHKGTVVDKLLEAAPASVRVLAIGDDRTDEDIFRSVPAGSVTVKVGPGTTDARYRVGSVADVRLLLRMLVDATHPRNTAAT